MYIYHPAVYVHVRVRVFLIVNQKGEIEVPVEWVKFEHTLPVTMRVFAIESERGGVHRFHSINDVCIDDFSVRLYPCGCKRPTSSIICTDSRRFLGELIKLILF